jgi:hypothetical protein
VDQNVQNWPVTWFEKSVLAKLARKMIAKKSGMQIIG